MASWKQCSMGGLSGGNSVQRKTSESSNGAAIKIATPPAKRAPSKSAATSRAQRGAAAAAVRQRQAAEPHRDLLSWRKEFPILQRKTYLNSCSLGALSTRSMAGMARFQELW